MNRFLHGVTRAAIETFSPSGPILEIGSYQVPDQEEIANFRPFFSGMSYVGVDIRHGPGVDVVASVEQLPFRDASVGAVLALNTFEHVARFWRGFEEIRRVLRPDGVFLVSCPFYFHIHHHPSDYWRFTPEALELLVEDYPARIIGWQGPQQKPLHVWAVAFRERRTITLDEYNRYRHSLARYAREPQSWTRRLRYLAGRLLCGSRPFLPYLQQNKWETVCHPPFFADKPKVPTVLLPKLRQENERKPQPALNSELPSK